MPIRGRGDLCRDSIILVSDEEFETLANDPDRVDEFGNYLHAAGRESSAESANGLAGGPRTLIIALTISFASTAGSGGSRGDSCPTWTNTSHQIAKIGRFAQQFGLGLELSLLSPLEIGPAYERSHWRGGPLDALPQGPARSGDWRIQRPALATTRWTNNKGPIDVRDAGVRVFAFRERDSPGTPYRVVKPESIVEISDVAKVESWDGHHDPGGPAELACHGSGRTDIGARSGARRPAVPYTGDGLFQPQAPCRFSSDWSTSMQTQASNSTDSIPTKCTSSRTGPIRHHDHGEFAVRYVSDGLARLMRSRYGEQYADFAKYLVYFIHGQEDFAHDLTAKEDVMHVFGDTPEAIRRTALFRARYYRLLQNGVVDLFVAAKRHAEQRMGHRLQARAHATWAESPPIDQWDTGGNRRPAPV